MLTTVTYANTYIVVNRCAHIALNRIKIATVLEYFSNPIDRLDCNQIQRSMALYSSISVDARYYDNARLRMMVSEYHRRDKHMVIFSEIKSRALCRSLRIIKSAAD